MSNRLGIWLSRYRLARAYRTVFNSEDGRIVLRDLAQYCGYYTITTPGTSNKVLQYNEGMRAAFYRIFSKLSLTSDDMKALAQEARELSTETNEEDF